ncbi:MAG: hypothetical protein QOJ92_2612 [Frankiales bacterium]|nr:hypothetical protein [Frankiales bacterium]
MLTALVTDVDDVTRESARRAAEHELLRPEYHHVKPLIVRLLDYVGGKIGDLLDAAASAAPGGAFGLVGIVLLLALTATLIRYRVGRLAATAKRRSVFETHRALTAAEHRSAAEAAAMAGDWTAAVRERFRALVRSLEERTLLEPRVGRTADEAVAEAALALPSAAHVMRSAADRFDEVVYGGRQATAESYQAVVAADDAAMRTQPVLT